MGTIPRANAGSTDKNSRNNACPTKVASVKKLSLTKVFALILVAGIVTGLVVAKRYTANRVENPATWRALDQPFRDTSAEEYTVYSTIIDTLHHEERLRVFPIRDHTAPCARKNEWCSPGHLRNRLRHL